MPMDSLPLRDIHLPLPIGIVPLALGWWFLIAALLIAILVVLILILRHRKPTALRQALKEFDCLFAKNELNDVVQYQEISLILKKLAVTTNLREDVAGLSGKEWILWVRSQVGNTTLSDQLLDFLKFGPYSSKGQIIQNKDAFRTEMQNLLIAVGGQKGSLLSKRLKSLSHLTTTSMALFAYKTKVNK